MITIHMTTARRYQSGLLHRAVASVLNQSFEDFEFIVCDDASTDGTSDYLMEVARSDERVKVIGNNRNVNNVAISLGKCMRAASSERRWVSWMFDDCVMLPSALDALVSAAKRRDAKVTYGVTEVLVPGGHLFPVGNMPFDDVCKHISQSSVLVPNGGILVDRDVFDMVGWYDPNIVLRRSCDWDLFVRMISAGVRFDTIEQVVMRELGELQPDSLRNAFTTDLSLMAKFMRARNKAGVRIDLANAFVIPADWIPPADWSDQELGLIRYIFLEYFLSTANMPRALRWARRLATNLDEPSLMMDVLAAAGDGQGSRNIAAVAAHSALVLAAYKEKLQRQTRH